MDRKHTPQADTVLFAAVNDGINTPVGGGAIGVIKSHTQRILASAPSEEVNPTRIATGGVYDVVAFITTKVDISGSLISDKVPLVLGKTPSLCSNIVLQVTGREAHRLSTIINSEEAY